MQFFKKLSATFLRKNNRSQFWQYDELIGEWIDFKFNGAYIQLSNDYFIFWDNGRVYRLKSDLLKLINGHISDVTTSPNAWTTISF